MEDCANCDFNDEDYGCTCPYSDKWYACSIENKKPENIKIELRIYQSGEAIVDNPDPEVIRAIMNKIVESDRYLRKLKEEER